MAAGRASRESRLLPYAFLLPGLALFAVFFAWPAAMAVRLSFYDYDVVSPARFVGLDNFRRLLTDERFHLALGNSALYLVGMIPFAVVIPMWLAVLVNQKVRGIGAFRAMYYLPAICSMVAIGVAWRYIFHEKGVLNWILIESGVIDRPIQYLLDENWALPGLVLVEGWKMLGFFMMIYLAGLQSIPQEVFEAAQVDGAGPLRRMWHLTVPLLLPYTAVTLTLGMLDALRIFESIYVMTRGGPQDSTISLGYLAWSTAFERYQLGYASAIGLVMLVLMIGLALLNQRITRER